jgi:outer membrane protein
MKNTKFLVALIALFIAGFSVNAQTAIKIGYTNLDYILQNIPDAKDIEAKLKTESAQYDKLYQDKVADFQKKYEAFQALPANTSQVIKADKEKELQTLQTAIQEFQQNAQGELQRKQQQLLAPVLEKINKAINDVAKEAGYTHVFNTDAGPGTTAILFVAPTESDISDLVFKKLGTTPPAKTAPAATNTAAPAVKKN